MRSQDEMIKISQEEFKIQELIPELIQEDTGAIVCFLGIVRGISEKGDRVAALEYESYTEPASRILEGILKQAKQTFGIQKSIVIHRIGRLLPGQQILAICVSASHSDQAFGACQYILKQLKSQVPIWKKEITDKAEHWIGFPESNE